MLQYDCILKLHSAYTRIGTKLCHAILPLTNMRYTSGWGVKSPLVLRAFCLYRKEDMTTTGFYVIADKFFEDFPDPYLKRNDGENRPHYYCFRGESCLFWVIPMSSRHQKYQAIINKRVALNRPTDFLHVAKLDNGKVNAFLIGDMFPVSAEYIVKEYTINNNHLRVTSDSLARQIESKAKTVLGLLRRGIQFSPTQPDVLAIEQTLLRR